MARDINPQEMRAHVAGAMRLHLKWTENEKLKLLPATEFLTADPEDFFLWCLSQSRYLVPTLELIEWLKPYVAGRRAIEICAGMGDLGRLLGIKSTDSRIQEKDPKLRRLYLESYTMPTTPPVDVLTMEASEAVKRLRPHVVISAWGTQLFKRGDTENTNAFLYGVDDEAILKKVDTYIVIGSTHNHGDKRILRFPHETYQPPWLVSRAKDRSSNVIYVWHRDKL